MFGLTWSRYVRWAVYIVTGYMAVGVVLLSIDISAGRQSLTAGTVFRDLLDVAVLAVMLASLRIPARSRGLIAAHAALMRRCNQVSAGRRQYSAVDKETELAVTVIRLKRFWRPMYFIGVMEVDGDWDYDPATMRNQRYLTGTFYSTSPGVADVRKFTEAATEVNGRFEPMARADQPSLIREAFAVARAHRELNFATVDELRGVVALLDRAEPFDLFPDMSED